METSMAAMHYGASPDEWHHFSQVLHLTDDILPVVCNPKLPPAQQSSLKSVGKTPSKVTAWGRVVGIGAWTSKVSTQAEIDRWAQHPDHGLCIQTRRLHALDFDITDPDLAAQAEGLVRQALGVVPVRSRSNSSKFLIPLYVTGSPEPLRKRVIKLTKAKDGIIEFLAQGQQFVAIGHHSDGVRYEWRDTKAVRALPTSFPTLTLEAFEALWLALITVFGDVRTAVAEAQKPARLTPTDVVKRDPVAVKAMDMGIVKSISREGTLAIVCPWADEHSGESSETATVYWPANTGGYARGHFKCMHTHCLNRSTEEFRREIGADTLDFDILTDDEDVQEEVAHKAARFEVISVGAFLQTPAPRWLVKGVLPEAGLAVVFGESGSGKSFWVLDLIASIAQGTPWRGKAVVKRPCLYICAEGVGGARNRVAALCAQQGLAPDGLNLGVIPDAPNLLKTTDVKALIQSVEAWGARPGVIVIDTLAQTTPGANENSGEDMGLALAHCKTLHQRTGALVVLVHHSGKDKGKGARGWSGLRAAADVEIEVLHEEGQTNRMAEVTKQKDGEAGLQFPFLLAGVAIGQDEDGETISSCVVDHLDGRTPGHKSPEVVGDKVPRGRIAPRGVQIQVLEALHVLGELSEDADRGVSLTELIEVVVSKVPHDPQSKRDRRREEVMRAVRSLQDYGSLSTSEGRVFSHL